MSCDIAALAASTRGVPRHVGRDSPLPTGANLPRCSGTSKTADRSAPGSDRQERRCSPPQSAAATKRPTSFAQSGSFLLLIGGLTSEFSGGTSTSGRNTESDQHHMWVGRVHFIDHRPLQRVVRSHQDTQSEAAPMHPTISERTLNPVDECSPQSIRDPARGAHFV